MNNPQDFWLFVWSTDGSEDGQSRQEIILEPAALISTVSTEAQRTARHQAQHRTGIDTRGEGTQAEPGRAESCQGLRAAPLGIT